MKGTGCWATCSRRSRPGARRRAPRRRRPRRRSRRSDPTGSVMYVLAGACFLAVALTLSCSRAARPGAVSPADVAALEAQQARHPADPVQNLRLAQAYYAAGRFADARRTAARTLELQPANDGARVYLGLSYEGLAQFDSARATYTRLLAARPSKAVRRLLAGRLAMMTRAELVWAARQAIARE